MKTEPGNQNFRTETEVIIPELECSLTHHMIKSMCKVNDEHDMFKTIGCKLLPCRSKKSCISPTDDEINKLKNELKHVFNPKTKRNSINNNPSGAKYVVAKNIKVKVKVDKVITNQKLRRKNFGSRRGYRSSSFK